VAVDGTGAVYLSEDAGSHWESVAKQWSGRVVAVRMQTAAGLVVPVQSAVFEIVNDRGQVWVSADGRAWKAK
jgi:photosystem II stability/assembly factor-like uncharacterized protein